MITCDATGAQQMRRLQQIASFKSPFLIDNHQASTKRQIGARNNNTENTNHNRVKDQNESRKKICLRVRGSDN